MRTWLVMAALACVVACGKEDAREEPRCGPDPFEPDDEGAPLRLETIEDDPFGSNTRPQSVSVVRTIHGEDDVDYFTIDVKDTGIGGNPKVEVLTPSGFEATVTAQCTSGRFESLRCLRGIDASPSKNVASCTSDRPPDPDLAAIAQLEVECAGTSSDDIRLSVVVRRLTPSPECAPYRLTISAD